MTVHLEFDAANVEETMKQVEYAFGYFGYFEPITYQLVSADDNTVEIFNPSNGVQKIVVSASYNVVIDVKKVNLDYEDIRKIITYINPSRWEVDEWDYDEYEQWR